MSNEANVRLRHGSLDPDALEELGRDHEGAIVTPFDERYASVRRNFLATFDGIHPRLIAECASVHDVRVAVEFTRHHRLPISVRSGGHCFAGFSLCDGLVIDLRELRDVDTDRDHLTVGTGARLGEVADRLDPRGRALPSGSCPTVGVGGQTLGGGLGILGRLHGFTCDQLVGAEVVLADGRVVRCSDREHTDLFWALRGAGAGGFGVVTRMDFSTVEAPDMTTYYLAWPIARAATALEVWQECAPVAPDAMAAGLALTAPPGAAAVVELYGAASGPETDAGRWLDSFVRALGTPPSTDVRMFGSYRHAALHQAGLLDISGSDVTERSPDGIERQGYRLTRSELIGRSLPRALIDELVEVFTADRRDSQYRGLELAPFGGAYGRVPSDATAYYHRDVRYSLKHAVLLPPAADATERRHARVWVDRSWGIVNGSGTGRVYPNFPDPALTLPLDAYYGPHLPRLADVRRQYDPTDTFGFAHAIPLTHSA